MTLILFYVNDFIMALRSLFVTAVSGVALAGLSGCATSPQPSSDISHWAMKTKHGTKHTIVIPRHKRDLRGLQGQKLANAFGTASGYEVELSFVGFENRRDIDHPFMVSTMEVDQYLYDSVIAYNRGYKFKRPGKSDAYARYVKPEGASEFIAALNEITGQNYRLLTPYEMQSASSIQYKKRNRFCMKETDARGGNQPRYWGYKQLKPVQKVSYSNGLTGMCEYEDELTKGKFKRLEKKWYNYRLGRKDEFLSKVFLFPFLLKGPPISGQPLKKQKWVSVDYNDFMACSTYFSSKTSCDPITTQRGGHSFRIGYTPNHATQSTLANEI